jgi:thiol-disulfide isomerase/thioredoxin
MKKILVLLIACSLSISCLAQNSITVYVFVAEECPVCNYISKSLKKISEEYNENVEFVAVFPQKMSSYKTSSLFKRKYGLDNYKIQLDHELIITKKYNAAVTPEVVVVDENGNVLYQGRINNSYAAPGRMRHGRVTEDLDIALQKIIEGQPIPKPWPDPIGCYITK